MTLGLGRIGAPLEDEDDWNRLIDALRNRESSGGKPLVSRKGALGSLQLMPGTADDMLKALGRRDVLNLPDQERYRRVRFDRDLNEELGQQYLRQQIKAFGHPVLALAAYNGGPANVRRWLKRFGDPRKGEIDLASFVEKIPFAETRSYVKKVAADAGLPVGKPVAPEPTPFGFGEALVARAPAPSPILGEPTQQSPLSRLLGEPIALTGADALARLLSRA